MAMTSMSVIVVVKHVQIRFAVAQQDRGGGGWFINGGACSDMVRYSGDGAVGGVGGSSGSCGAGRMADSIV